MVGLFLTQNGKSKVLFKLSGELNIKELYLCTFIYLLRVVSY